MGDGMVTFWKITDRIGRVFSIPYSQLGVGATTDAERLPVLTFYARSEHPEHLPLFMVRRMELKP
jgi:hypothetical protein